MKVRPAILLTLAGKRQALQHAGQVRLLECTRTILQENEMNRPRSRLKFIIDVFFDAVGVAVLLIMAYALVALANDFLNGGV